MPVRQAQQPLADVWSIWKIWFLVFWGIGDGCSKTGCICAFLLAVLLPFQVQQEVSCRHIASKEVNGENPIPSSSSVLACKVTGCCYSVATHFLAYSTTRGIGSEYLSACMARLIWRGWGYKFKQEHLKWSQCYRLYLCGPLRWAQVFRNHEEVPVQVEDHLGWCAAEEKQKLCIDHRKRYVFTKLMLI